MSKWLSVRCVLYKPLSGSLNDVKGNVYVYVSSEIRPAIRETIEDQIRNKVLVCIQLM